MKYLLIFMLGLAISNTEEPEIIKFGSWMDKYSLNSIDSLIVYHNLNDKKLKSVFIYTEPDRKLLKVKVWEVKK